MKYQIEYLNFTLHVEVVERFCSKLVVVDRTSMMK